MPAIVLSEVPKRAIPLISLRDAAFDHAEITPEMRVIYERTREFAHLPVKPGDKPITAWCRPLDVPTSGEAKRAAAAKGSTGLELCLQYFELGCERVEGLVQRTPDSPLKAGEIQRRHWNRIPLEVRSDIGWQIYEMTHPDEDAEAEEHPGK